MVKTHNINKKVIKSMNRLDNNTVSVYILSSAAWIIGYKVPSITFTSAEVCAQHLTVLVA